MIVDSLITSVSKYFSDKSVNSLWGYKKISLLEIDESKIPTGLELEIDATSTANVTISKSVIQHSAETKKVYMDGTRVNPTKMSLSGHIDVTKLLELQRMAADDVWMYVTMTKDMGGSVLSMSDTSQLGLLADNITTLGGILDDPTIQIYNDCKPYVIQNLSISDTGFINTVEVSIDLIEVVIFDIDLRYKYGVKQTKKGSGKAQAVTTGPPEIKEPPHKTEIGGTK